MDFIYGGLYIGNEDGEFYCTFFHATNESTGEKLMIYYNIKDRSKVLALSLIEFREKFTFHEPYPNLKIEKNE